jgi:hypothetical protein
VAAGQAKRVGRGRLESQLQTSCWALAQKRKGVPGAASAFQSSLSSSTADSVAASGK